MPASKKRPKAAQKARAERAFKAQQAEMVSEGMRHVQAMVSRRVDMLDWVGSLVSLGSQEAGDNVVAIRLTEETKERIAGRIRFASSNGAMTGMGEDDIARCVTLVDEYMTSLVVLHDGLKALLGSEDETQAVLSLMHSGELTVPRFMEEESQLGAERWIGGVVLSSTLLAYTSLILEEQEARLTEVMDKIVKRSPDEEFGTHAALLVGAMATDIALFRRWPTAQITKLRLNTFGPKAAKDGMLTVPLGGGKGLLALTNLPMIEGLMVDGGGLWEREYVTRAAIHALRVLKELASDMEQAALTPNS